MKLSDLFRRDREKKPTQETSESVKPDREEEQIFEESESYTTILENIDSDEANEFQTQDLGDILTEEELQVSDSVGESEDEAAPESTESEHTPEKEPEEIDYFAHFRETSKMLTEEVASEDTLPEIKTEASEETAFTDLDETLKEPDITEPEETETVESKTEPEKETLQDREFSIEAMQVIPETKEVEDDEGREVPESATTEEAETPLSMETTLHELKEEERAYLEDVEEETPSEVREVSEAESEEGVQAQETEPVEESTEKEREKKKKRPKFTVSNIFKRRRKEKEEPQLTAPLDTIMERAQEELKPMRKTHAEFLLSNALKEETANEKTREFEKILSPVYPADVAEAPTIEFKIEHPPKEETEEQTDLLAQLNASPVIEENLKKGIEEEQGISLPDSTAVTRRKDLQRQLRRQEKATRERVSSETLEMAQKSEKITKKKSLIFANVPDNILKGGILLFNNLAQQMDSLGTLRVESLMSILGALAGYSIQAGIREKMINRLQLSEDQVFSIVETKNGERYYFGDPIDRALQKDKSSLWYMIASATQRLTGHVDSNLDETVRYTTRNIGKETFGIPRIPRNHRPNHTPQYYVEHMWEALVPGLERFTDDPLQWPLVFSVALQRALICTKNILDPNISLKIILESAIPMTAADINPMRSSTQKLEEIEAMTPQQLREQIKIIRANLETSLSAEQRQELLNELAIRTEQLYDALSPTEVTLQIQEEKK